MAGDRQQSAQACESGQTKENGVTPFKPSVKDSGKFCRGSYSCGDLKESALLGCDGSHVEMAWIWGDTLIQSGIN